MVENYKDLIAAISAKTAQMRQDIPDVMQGFNAMALSVGSRCDPCIGFHGKALVKLGATRAEVQEMLGMCVYMGGGPSLMYAAAALAAYEEFGGEKAA